jgi:cytochrome P450/NADPH-cytochrome P450 reductase
MDNRILNRIPPSYLTLPSIAVVVLSSIYISKHNTNHNMEHETIPGPPGLPIVGNLADIDTENPIKSLCTLTATYGPIWRFYLPGGERIVIASQALMNEVCDEERFSKIVAAALKEVRNGIHDSLFTAYGPEERNWGIAHRVLLPQLGPLAIRNMFSEMHDVASQLVMKWARHGAGHTIQVVDDFTRLTLDTIALCAMDASIR